MAEKDITQKTLEAYNDVFADIVNVLLFDGERVIKPEDLTDRTPRSSFKADGKVREIERDVVKQWVRNNIRIACIGLENQTEPDPWMALRVMGYDGTEYAGQLRKIREGEKPSAVVTLVLYFGYKHHWRGPLTVLDALEVPEKLKPYITNARVNLFEIAYLSHEQVEMFESDFKEVARYFVQMRENGNYQPTDQKMKHIHEVLQLLNVMDRDHRFETEVNLKSGEKEVRSMSEWLTRVLNESRAEGIEKGRATGLAEGRATGLAEGRATGLAEGKITILSGLVKDQLISVEEAAKRAGMSQAEFRKKAGLNQVQ